MKVFIVVENVDGITNIGGVYSKYHDAFEHAECIADYAGLELYGEETDCWCSGDIEYDDAVMVLAEEVQ